MDSIDLNDLRGYQEDSRGLRDFQRPYLIPCLAGMIIALAGLVTVFSEMQASHYYRGQTPGMLNLLWFHFLNMAHSLGVPPSVEGYVPTIIFVTGLLIFFVTIVRMATVVPSSSIPNVKMEKYWNSNPERHGDKEIIYVDRAAKTYFRRVFVSQSGPRMPSSPWVP